MMITNQDTPTCSCHRKIDIKDDKCFLCSNPGGSEGVHDASTYNIDAKECKCTTALNDSVVLAELEPGDMIALEAKHHWNYLESTYITELGYRIE